MSKLRENEDTYRMALVLAKSVLELEHTSLYVDSDFSHDGGSVASDFIQLLRIRIDALQAHHTKRKGEGYV